MTKEYMVEKMMIERSGVEDEISIEGDLEYSTDIFYGADANGGRAASRTFVEDIKDINAWDADGDEIKLTPEEVVQAERVFSDKFLMG